MIVLVVFKDCDVGVPIPYWTDGSIVNLRRLQARSKVCSSLIQDLLFTDDCALVAHNQIAAQQFFDRFAKATHRFGFTVSLKKTEVMLLPSNKQNYSAAVIQVADIAVITPART